MIERLIWSNGSGADYFFLVLWVGFLLARIRIFRLGLASVPPDPNSERLNPGLD